MTILQRSDTWMRDMTKVSSSKHFSIQISDAKALYSRTMFLILRYIWMRKRVL